MVAERGLTLMKETYNKDEFVEQWNRGWGPWQYRRRRATRKPV